MVLAEQPTQRRARRGFFARMKPAMTAARTRLGAGGPNHLLGFSNGAYFAALIATRSFGPFDAIAIAHGGPVQPTRAAGTTPPLLLITADDDPSDGEMRQLDAELVREKWPHEFVGREGAHALLDWDVDIALTFFARAEKEKLPLAPPLQPPRPRVVKNEAGEDEPASAKPSAGEPSVAQGTPASRRRGREPLPGRRSVEEDGLEGVLPGVSSEVEEAHRDERLRRDRVEIDRVEGGREARERRV